MFKSLGFGSKAGKPLGGTIISAPAVDVKIDQKVVVHQQVATVRYVGPTSHGPGEWIGIEFVEGPHGTSDGSISADERLFQCTENFGLFVRNAHVRIFNKETERAIKDAKEKRKRTSFHNWVGMEYTDEYDYNASETHSAHVKTILAMTNPQQGHNSAMKKVQRSTVKYEVTTTAPGMQTWTKKMEGIQVEKGYSGPELPPDFSRKHVLAMLRTFKENPNNTLHRKYAYYLLIKTKELLHNKFAGTAIDEPPSPKDDEQLVIVGDTHGQLNDMLWIFHCLGDPSKTNRYLINGDVADRGKNAVEIFLLLFAFWIIEPNSITINRGNHENADINERPLQRGGGFADEVRDKYDGQMFDLFQEIFVLFPIASVVGNEILVMHAGLPRYPKTTIDQLRKVNNKRQVPEMPSNHDDTLLVDCLWSDPQDENGMATAKRGDGVMAFGPDVTAEFLKKNGLKLLIRSHEVPKTRRGYEMRHNGKLITIFSASNYCGRVGNTGAVIMLRMGESPRIKEYMAPDMAEILALDDEKREKEGPPEEDEKDTHSSSATATVFKQKSTLKDLDAKREKSDQQMHNDIILSLKERICTKRSELWSFFAQQDEGGEGVCSLDEWANAMEVVLKMDLEWPLYAERLATVVDSKLNYYDFLSRYRIELTPKYSGWQKMVVKKIYDAILGKNMSITETFSYFDVDGDGKVSVSEFSDVILALDLGLTEPQVVELMHSLGLSEFQTVDTTNFLVRFQIMYKYMVLSEFGGGKGEQKLDAEFSDVLRVVAEMLNDEDVAAVEELFTSFDANRDGFVSYDEFVKGMTKFQERKKLPTPLSKDQWKKIAKYVDVNKDGKMNYLEFMDAFQAVDPRQLGPCSLNSVVQHICNCLYENRAALHKSFVFFDPDGDGWIKEKDFMSALQAVNAIAGNPARPLSDTQVEELVKFLPKEKGEVSYNEFLAAFHVVDGEEL